MSQARTRNEALSIYERRADFIAPKVMAEQWIRTGTIGEISGDE